MARDLRGQRACACCSPRIAGSRDRRDRTYDPALADLAWDLGADFVVFPPFSWEQLPSVVTGLMELPAAEQPEVIAEE